MIVLTAPLTDEAYRVLSMWCGEPLTVNGDDTCEFFVPAKGSMLRALHEVCEMLDINYEIYKKD